MANITLKKNPVQTNGDLPKGKAPNFILVDKDLKDRSLQEFLGKKVLLSTNPSLDTAVCATTTKTLNEMAKKHPDLMILIITKDLPFAQKRFCEQEKLQNILTLSMMRGDHFAKDYGLFVQDGPLQGLIARAVLLLDEKHSILYSELVSEITDEPNYEKLQKALR